MVSLISSNDVNEIFFFFLRSYLIQDFASAEFLDGLNCNVFDRLLLAPLLTTV